MDLERFRQINEQNAQKGSEDARHSDLVLSNMQTQEIILKSFSSLVEYLENHISKTEVINQLQAIGTPDVAFVVQALEDLHETLKTHENTDLSEVTQVMRELLEQARQIPKELPSIDIPEPIDPTKQLEAITAAVKALQEALEAKDLHVEAPQVKVEAPEVHVDAPDLKPLTSEINKEFGKAIKSIVFPEYKTDNTEVEKQLKKLNKKFDEFLDAPVSSGGGGSGRATPYEDADGNPLFVQLNTQGAIPVSDADLAVQIEESGSITYIGKAAPGSLASDEVWQIKKIDETSGTSITWASGNANFINSWDNRASLSYS